MSEGGGPPSRTLVVRRGYQPGPSGAPAGQSPRPTWKASVASRASATIVISSVGRSARIRSASGDLRTRSSARRRPVRDDQTRHAPRLGDRGHALRDVGRLDHQDLGPEVGRVVEQLPDPAHPLGGGAFIGRGRDDDRQQRGAQHRGGRGGPSQGARRGRCVVEQDEDALAHALDRPGRSGPLELRIHAAGHEPERELAESGQVRLGEEAVERDAGALLAVDVAVAHPLPERVRAHVDELDLVRRGEHLVGDPLVDRSAGDGGDRVRDRVEMLDVAGADDVDARHRAGRRRPPSASSAAEPGAFVWASSSTSATVGRAGEDGIGVHLLDDDAAVLDAPTRDDLEPVEELLGLRPAVRLDEPDDEVRSAPGPAMRPPPASGTSCRRPGAIPR